MCEVPPRHPLLVLASVFGAFVCGPALGVAVAAGVAPGSELARTVSPLAFALAFATGLLLWFGIGVLSVVAGFVLRLVRGQWRRQPRPGPLPDVVPPGYGAFLSVSLAFGGVAGTIVGLSPQTPSLAVSCLAHLAAGAAYGGALRALAYHGYLPFPEPS